MAESQSGLGSNGPTNTSNAENLPPAESLQFKKAEHVSDSPATQTCHACKRTFSPPYFQVNGIVVCPDCAKAIELSQNARPSPPLGKAFIYGLGAAIAGAAIYAAVVIFTGLELALIAILIGYMVGKAIRHGSGGFGGRPQQIMAVLLTYFAITTSYIPFAIHNRQATTSLFILALGAPFLSLTNMSGLISLLIIFFGLQRAWILTRHVQLIVSGPYAT